MSLVTYSIEELIERQRQEFEGFKAIAYVPRAQESKLRGYLESSLIKIVMGPRRAGKSRLIQKVLENEKVAYINFEEERFSNVTGEQIIEAAHKIYPSAKYWYLDEIQDFFEWEKILNKLHRRGYNLVVTGSNARLLSSELATALTGRHLPLELFPFSYSEFLQARNIRRSWESFGDYLDCGGFPEVVLNTALDPGIYLNTLFDSIVLKDLIKRKSIRVPAYLTNSISLLIQNISSRTSARAIAKALNNTPTYTTVEKYIEYVREAYLIETIHAFKFKPKERIQSERKPYSIDTGFIKARTRQVLSLQGRQLENAVYLELRRRGYAAGDSLFYYRSDEGLEVDFLVREGHVTTQLIQVCLDLSSFQAQDREVRALLKAKLQHPDASLLIVTANESGSIEVSNGQAVKLVPVFEFCA